MLVKLSPGGRRDKERKEREGENVWMTTVCVCEREKIERDSEIESVNGREAR